jgi:hypothetical protein
LQNEHLAPRRQGTQLIHNHPTQVFFTPLWFTSPKRESAAMADKGDDNRIRLSPKNSGDLSLSNVTGRLHGGNINEWATFVAITPIARGSPSCR